jgi:hypothetical protein
VGELFQRRIALRFDIGEGDCCAPRGTLKAIKKRWLPATVKSEGVGLSSEPFLPHGFGILSATDFSINHLL